MSAREIAEVLEIPQGTAQTRLARARELLGERLERLRSGAGLPPTRSAPRSSPTLSVAPVLNRTSAQTRTIGPTGHVPSRPLGRPRLARPGRRAAARLAIGAPEIPPVPRREPIRAARGRTLHIPGSPPRGGRAAAERSASHRAQRRSRTSTIGSMRPDLSDIQKRAADLRRRAQTRLRGPLRAGPACPKLTQCVSCIDGWEWVPCSRRRRSRRAATTG